MDYDLTKITINYVVGSVLMFGLMKMPIPGLVTPPFKYIALFSIMWPVGIASLFGIDTAKKLLCE